MIFWERIEKKYHRILIVWNFFVFNDQIIYWIWLISRFETHRLVYSVNLNWLFRRILVNKFKRNYRVTTNTRTKRNARVWYDILIPLHVSMPLLYGPTVYIARICTETINYTRLPSCHNQVIWSDMCPCW